MPPTPRHRQRPTTANAIGMARAEAERQFIKLVSSMDPEFDPSQTQAVRWSSAGRSASRSVSYSQSHPAHHRATPARENLLFAMDEAEREGEGGSGSDGDGDGDGDGESVIDSGGRPQGRTLQRPPSSPFEADARPAAMPTSLARPLHASALPLRALAFAAHLVVGEFNEMLVCSS